MINIGKVEKKVYELRREHPLVIPQIDPQKMSGSDCEKIYREIEECGINHIAIGGSIVNPQELQTAIDIAVKDFDFSIVTYLTNASVGFVKGSKGRTAVYWMSVLNAENMYFLRDVLVMNSVTISQNELEPIPTVYIFDDRGKMKTANWLTRSVPVPRDRPDISLSIALAAQHLGVRFYVMAGGSGSEMTPPEEHVKLLSNKTNMFIIPTSGIMTQDHAKLMFTNGADAIHVGKIIEQPRGISVLKKMIETSKKFDGKEFL